MKSEMGKSIGMKKVGITLSDRQLQAIEQIRRKNRLPRSRVIQRALDDYLARLEREKAIHAYVEGYRRKPQAEAEAEAYSKAAAEALEPEDWS